MARAIVTYARGWQALAITRSLGRKGIEVYCGEEAPFAPSFFSRYCTESFQHPSPTQDPEGFIDFMVEKVKALKPEGNEPYVLIPVHKETWLIAKNRERFEPHVKLALTSYDNMALTHDKGKLPDLANELGILIPETHRFTTLDEMKKKAEELTYPRFLKMREGAAGVGLKKVKSAGELVSSFEEFVSGYGLEPDSYPLVQEFIEGDDYCVTTLFDRGRWVAKMTYRNVRAFPRVTGAGSLREAVEFNEAEQEAVRLLEHLKWHGIAELDFRKAEDGPPYLIEINPRIFGGLPQALAANVDYPHLLFRIAAGEEVETPEVDYSTRTETPITGMLATLDEIAHDDDLLDRLRRIRSEVGKVAYSDVTDADLNPLFDALKEAANPKDLKDYFAKMFEKHQGTIDDVLQKDDPTPALGFLFPIALMLKHGKVSMGVLTSEAELEATKPRRSLRKMIRQPTWRVLFTTAFLYAVSIFLMNFSHSADNVGWILAWPARVGALILGEVQNVASPLGAVKQTLFHMLNLGFLYLLAALLLRQPRTVHGDEKG